MKSQTTKDFDTKKLDKMFEEIRKMEITPFGYILDFMIEQGLTLKQAKRWYADKA